MSTTKRTIFLLALLALMIWAAWWTMPPPSVVVKVVKKPEPRPDKARFTWDSQGGASALRIEMGPHDCIFIWQTNLFGEEKFHSNCLDREETP